MGSFLPPSGVQKWNFINQTSVCDILSETVVLTATLPPTISVVFPSALDAALGQTQCSAANSPHCSYTSHKTISNCLPVQTHIWRKFLPLKIYSLGKESGLSSSVAALVTDTLVFELSVELTTKSDSPSSGLLQTCSYSTYELSLNPDEIFGLLFHMPLHEQLTRKMSSRRKNASRSAAWSETAIPEGWLIPVFSLKLCLLPLGNTNPHCAPTQNTEGNS